MFGTRRHERGLVPPIPRRQGPLPAYSRPCIKAACVHMLAQPAARPSRGESPPPPAGVRGGLGGAGPARPASAFGRRRSELVARRAVQGRLQDVRVLGLAAQGLLLPHLLGLGAVPVGLHVLVVPHD